MKHIFCVFSVFSEKGKEGMRSRRAARRRETGEDVASDETRRMMCPSKPTNAAGLYKHTCFSPLSCFHLHFLFVTYVPGAVYSGPLFRSSVALAEASPGVFHALFSVTPPPPFATEGGGVQSHNFVFFFFFLLSSAVHVQPHTLAQTTLHRSYLFAKPPFIFRFSFMLSLFVITRSHPPSLFLRASSPISGSPCCLLGMVSCHLCRMTRVAAETPPVWTPFIHTAHIIIQRNIWDTSESQTHLKPFTISSGSNCIYEYKSLIVRCVS